MSAISNISEPWNGHTNQEVEDFLKGTIPQVHIIDVTVSNNTFYAYGYSESMIFNWMNNGHVVYIRWGTDEVIISMVLAAGPGGGLVKAYNPMTGQMMYWD